MKQIATMNAVQTMTSREIAELTGKRHDNVIRDIEKITEEVTSDLRELIKCVESSTYVDSNRAKRKLYVVPPELAQVLIARANIRKPKAQCQTYFILNKESKRIKIGKTTNMHHRLKTLTNMSGCTLTLLHTIEGDVESELHQKFAAVRFGGEWFDNTDSVITEYIATLAA